MSSGARRRRDGSDVSRRAIPKSIGRELFLSLDRKWPADGVGAIAVVVAQLPDPAELPPGTMLLVRASNSPRRGLRRWLDAAKAVLRKPRTAHAAVRCTALLARGYRDISSGVDPKSGEELVWGLAPRREALTSDLTFGRSSGAR